jgi:site-specific recombinase XerC
MTSLAPHMEAFLREHLARHRGASQHTCDSYAVTVQVVRASAGAEKARQPDGDGSVLHQ